MNITRKIVFLTISFIFFLIIFTILDFGMEINKFIQLTQPIIFALTAVIAIFFLKLRKLILVISLSLLSLMIFTYLLSLLDISKWVGSLGFGMLFITIFSYLPQVIKKGYIEKF